MVCEQAVRRGGFTSVTDSMWLVLLFQGWYVVDGLYNEVRSTTHVSNARYLKARSPLFLRLWISLPTVLALCYRSGDLAWVPFVYSLQARYLVFKPLELGPLLTAVVVLVNATGYYIFRAANGEKNDFRNGKNPKSTSLTSETPSSFDKRWCRSQIFYYCLRF